MITLGNVKLFYDGLRIHFGEPRIPKDTKLDDFIANFIQDLAGFSDRVYDLAAQKLRTDPDATRSFPINGIILRACREVSQHLAAEVQPPSRNDKNPEWSKEAYAEANQLICSEIGRRAAAEGWIIGLWDFCRENRRWPNNFEAKRVMDKSLSTWRELQFIEDDEATLSNPKQLIKSFKRQRAHLSQIARGRIAA